MPTHPTIDGGGAPPVAGALRVELWGRRTAGGPLEKLGCESVPFAADGVGILEVGPRRADGPSGC